MTLDQLYGSHNLAVLSPEISLTLFAMLVLLAGAFLNTGTQKTILPLLALAGVGVAGAGTASLWNRNLLFGPEQTAIYSADNFALFFKWIFLLGLGVSVLLSGRFLNARGGDRNSVAGEFLGLMMLSTVGMMFVAGARDLLVVFLGIETLSIALYVLAGFARTRLMSNEAALKYFLLGAFASGFLLYGIALTYYAVGSTSLPAIADNLSRNAVRSQGILYAGLALLLIGLGFKAALVPFHQWTPDVYEGAPTPVTAFMATGAKAAAFAALMRVFIEAFPSMAPQLHPFLTVLAVLTMTVGNIIAISQDSIKRMLAYSSIAHAGYLLMGVLAASSAIYRGQIEAAQNSVAAVLFYVLCYALMNLGAFAVLVFLENARSAQARQSSTGLAEDGSFRTVTPRLDSVDSEDANLKMSDLAGLGWQQPMIAAAFALFLLSLAGIPPLAGFFGKFYIFNQTIEQGMWGLVVAGAINTVISVYYYLRPVVSMYMNTDTEIAPSAGLISPVSGDVISGNAIVPSGDAAATARPVALPLGALFAVILCAVAVAAMFILQTAALSWAQEAATSFLKLGN
jgi:NADH-quinone oxidoreductase subunit N